jgi:anaerobic magnesium-protoporphyrin IX monomethyl ester cyclase
MALTEHERRVLPFLLMNPPLTDPTCPYHSIPYLLAATEARGFLGGCAVDTNVDALNHLARYEHVSTLLARARQCLADLEHKPVLTRLDEMRYRCALKGLSLTAEMPSEAIETFRNQTTFYDYPRYRQAVAVVNTWIDLLSLDGFVGQFDGLAFNYAHVVNFSSVADLSDPELVGRLAAPFASYLQTEFRASLHAQPWRLVGLSVNYVAQLPMAIHLARVIREELPDVRLCLGGTEISDIAKQLINSRDIWKLFPTADYLVVGEGEAAIVQLLESIDAPASAVRGPGIMTRSLIAGRPQVAYEDLATSGTPNYRVWNWPSYWSPEPVILYSPTRGCYWNRCTFCDYGLNTDSPTSPSRERPIETVVNDLQRVAEIGTTIYFAVDAMSPKYLRKLAASITQLGLSWSAELRLEKTFISSLSQELASSGCVAIAFGYESAAPRILALIDKGTQPENISKILGALREANIGVQMMGFTGFPSETTEEALMTYDFLIKHEDSWTLAGIGEFVLTTQSIVAKKPTQFGLERVVPTPGDDIVRSLGWVDATGQLHRTSGVPDAGLVQAARSIRRGGHNRPFVGGIDSSHSLLYFKKHGASLWPGTDEGVSSSGERACRPGRYHTPFSDLSKFCTVDDVARYGSMRRQAGASPSAAEVLNFLGEETSPPRDGGQIEVLSHGAYLVLSPEVVAVESNPSVAYLAAKEMLLRLQGL